MPGFVAELPTPTRLFTVEQANALLPDILPVVASLREHALALRAEQAVLDELARRAEEMGGVQPTAREAEAAVHACEHLGALDDAIGELQAAGVRVKDAERGLLDFPSERDGELIELCWLYGEHAVTHWHRIGEGYAQRRGSSGASRSRLASLPPKGESAECVSYGSSPLSGRRWTRLRAPPVAGQKTSSGSILARPAYRGTWELL